MFCAVFDQLYINYNCELGLRYKIVTFKTNKMTLLLLYNNYTSTIKIVNNGYTNFVQNIQKKKRRDRPHSVYIFLVCSPAESSKPYVRASARGFSFDS